MRLRASAALREKAVTDVCRVTQKNGEKRLRALLARTKQWNSKTERNRLAALMETRAAAAAPGSAAAASLLRLASALRTKRSAMLAKGHLLTCARAWGYASDVWYRHGRATRARLEREALAVPKQQAEDVAPDAEEAAAGGEADAQPSDTELRLSGGGFPWRSGFNLSDLSVDQARCEVERQLKPLALAAAAHLAGPVARLAAEQYGSSFFSAVDLQEVRYAAAQIGGFAEVWAAMRADAATIAARAAASPHAAVPAWRHLAGRRTELEESLHGFGEVLRSAAVSNCPNAYVYAPHVLDLLRDGTLDRLPLLDIRPPTEAQVAAAVAAAQGGTVFACTLRWLNEMFRGLCLVVEISLRLTMLLRDAKFAPYSEFCEVSCLMIDTVAMCTAASSAAFTERAAWMEEALAAAGAASPSDDSLASPQASSDDSAAANVASAKPRVLLFRLTGLGAAQAVSPNFCFRTETSENVCLMDQWRI